MLGIEDMQKISLCLNTVTVSTCNELFIAPSLKYIATIISGYGHTAGAFLGHSLIGFASFVYPRRGKNNLGHFFHYSEEELLAVTQLEHICVQPKYRRKGVAEQLIYYLMSRTNYHTSFFFSTVSPQNTPSLSLAFKLGQRIVSYNVIYGVNRFIMCRQISKRDKNCEKALIEISRQDINKISLLLSCGYEGIAFGSQKKTIIFDI